MCEHHWSIAPANGPTSEGVCLKCGEVKQFSNSLIESRSDWSKIQAARDTRRDEGPEWGVRE